jgi:coiled-coil domain-containing protein 12
VESTDGQGGMEGAALVEAMHVREREEEEDERREKELDAEDGLA